MSDRFSRQSRRGGDRPPREEVDRRDRPHASHGRDRDRDRDRDNNGRARDRDRDRDYRRYRSRSPDRRARDGGKDQDHGYGRERPGETGRESENARPSRYDRDAARRDRNFQPGPRDANRKRDPDRPSDRNDEMEGDKDATKRDSRRRSASPHRSSSPRPSRSPRFGEGNEVSVSDDNATLPRRNKVPDKAAAPVAPVSFKVKGQEPHRDGNQGPREQSWVAEQRGRSEERSENRYREEDGGRSGSRGRFDADPMEEDEDADDVEVADDGLDGMQAMMGFGGFGTTKGQKVVGNNVGAVRKEKKTEYRQYMNRVGGFNRPLSPTR